LPNLLAIAAGAGGPYLIFSVGFMVCLYMYIQLMYIHGTMSRPMQQPKTLRRDAVALVEACAGLHSRLAARRITQFLDRAVADCGLSLAQLGLMAHIAATADDTLSALAQRTGLDQSTLSRNLRTLEAGGLVELAMLETDLRRRMVWLTETGARRLEKAMPIWRAALAKLAKYVSLDLACQLADEAERLVEG
jgi:DNA-binding MarR family transcriptional regulator